MPAATTDQPLVRVSPTSKAALRAACAELGAATGRPVALGALIDDVLAAHLPAYMEQKRAQLAALQAPAPGGGR